ncbi:hypothetical protein T492DRAFT_1147255 [Pavlovales sp. CCMP2436]|nr:hypothetical protein T492DRAFT_1147255 [Pavlovales sp. CCMP2436]
MWVQGAVVALALATSLLGMPLALALAIYVAPAAASADYAVFRMGKPLDASVLAAASRDYARWQRSRADKSLREQYLRGAWIRSAAWRSIATYPELLGAAYNLHRAVAAAHGTDESPLYLVGVWQIRKRAGGRQRLHADNEFGGNAAGVCAGAGAVSVWFLTETETPLERSPITLVGNSSKLRVNIDELLSELDCWSPSTWNIKQPAHARCLLNTLLSVVNERWPGHGLTAVEGPRLGQGVAFHGHVWHETADNSTRTAIILQYASAECAMAMRMLRAYDARMPAERYQAPDHLPYWGPLSNPAAVPLEPSLSRGSAGTARAERCGDESGTKASAHGSTAINASSGVYRMGGAQKGRRSPDGAVSTYHWKHTVSTTHIGLITAQRVFYHAGARALASTPHVATSDTVCVVIRGRLTYAVSTTGVCGSYDVFDGLPGTVNFLFSRVFHSAVGDTRAAPLAENAEELCFQLWPAGSTPRHRPLTDNTPQHRATRGADAIYHPGALPTARTAPVARGDELAPGRLVEAKIVELDGGHEAAALGYKHLKIKVVSFGAGAAYYEHRGYAYDLLIVPIAGDIGFQLNGGREERLGPGAFAIVPAGARHGFRDRAGNATTPGGRAQRRGGTDVLMVEIASAKIA